MADKRLISNWESILLDTTIIINLFLHKKGASDPVCSFIYTLMKHLTTLKPSSGKERLFYISAITISEILSDETDKDLILDILKIVNSKNVEIVSFDDKIALDISQSLYHHLSASELNKLALSEGWKTHQLTIAREWINRDYMIAMSGKNRSDDLIALTADHKTFYKTCKNISVECAVCDPQFFNIAGEIVYEYFDYKAVSKHIIIPAVTT